MTKSARSGLQDSVKPLRKTMAARLPLPAELDAALNAAPRFKKSSVVPQTIESKADPHAFERQLLDDVLGGGGGAARPPRAAAGRPTRTSSLRWPRS